MGFALMGFFIHRPPGMKKALNDDNSFDIGLTTGSKVLASFFLVVRRTTDEGG